MSSLSHHGIKGQRWGIRRTPEQLGRINGGKPKVYKLNNYKGKLYFISENEMDGQTLNPRVPKNFLTENGYEDNTTERVCFSHDPGKCLTAMSANVSGKTFNVYSPADKHDVYKPNNIVVPDADITGELWIKEPVKLKKVGTIKCTGDTGEDGLEYSYGDNKAELYDWNYEWLEHCDFLSHHGIRGQRWGVRRFQNKDGTRTAAGKAREDRRVLKKGHVVSRVHLQNKDKTYDNKKYVSTNDEDHKKWVEYFGNEYARRWKPVYEQKYELKKDVYVANGKDVAKIVSTKLNKEMVERDLKGLETEAKAKGSSYNWAESNPEHQYSLLLARQTESGKQIIKELVKAGFGAVEDDHGKNVAKDPVIILNPEKSLKKKGKAVENREYLDAYSQWYTQEWLKAFGIQHTSIGGTMYIEGNALILGDSSYLEHHGIKGQRWGVRRFQNRDGSLTNAGRKRLGYATKGAVQTVGKAFKAGVKVGGNAVKAAKAHHEKKEAEKLQKKKEKASKTRLGVMANKDLFTNEEIRKLNERFKLEDEMKMATLQKGVEIAKAVGVIAQNVGTVAKAYEDVTGTSLSPIKKAKQEAEANEKAEDRKRKLAKEDAEAKRAEDKEKRDIEDRERRIKFEDEDRVRKQAKEDADAQRAENAEKRAQAKERRDSTMAVELQRKAKAAADEQEHKAVKAKAESRSAILDVLEKINKIQDHDDDDHNNPPGGGIDTWNDDDYLNFFKKTGIIHSDISDPSLIQNGVLFIDSSDGLTHHGVKGQRWGVRRFQNPDGSLTEKGRKHYEKAIEKLDRKQVNSDNRRGRLERQHPFAVTASAILTGSAYAALMVASAANPAMVVAGSAIAAAVSALGTHVDYSVAEAWEGRGTKRRQKKRKEYEEMLNHDGLIISDGTLYLEHHGIRGQRWGVRRFQNPDGTRTEAGKKHDAKLAAKAERKQAKADMKAAKAAAKAKAKDIKLTEKAENLRKREIERYEKMAVKQPHYKAAYETMAKHAKESDRSELLQINGAANARSVIQGIGAAMILGTFTPTPVAVAGGIAIAKAMKMTNVDYARTVNTNARLNKEARERKLKEAQSIKLEHSSGGMLIQNGTLFINAGEPYLEHHGVKGMKWGKHLMAGKGVDAEGGGGGGFAEDDEKLKEMAKKAGMSVAEFRTKMAGKLGGAASKVSIKDKHLVVNGSRSVGTRGLAVGETGEKPKSFKEKAYNALGGKYKSQAAEAHKDMVYYKNDADDIARRANAQGRAANANKRAGNVREYMANKEGARQLDTEAKGARVNQWEATAKANRAQWKYDHSIAGLYDKATGKYKQVHKRTKVPKTMDQAAYYYSEGPNSKLHNNGSSKAKTAKDQAKAAVWNAADHQIKAREHINEAATYGYNANSYGQAYVNASAREARLAEGSYRRAAALGKQAASEGSTSSRPRARKKRVTSGGSGVSVRKPGRKPVSRTKRVTKSSTGVKRRSATGSGARVRRGA